MPTTRAATELSAQIRRAIDGFQSGRTGWKALEALGRQAASMASKGLGDTAAGRALRAEAARIPQLQRSLGDDTGWDAVLLLKSSIRGAQEGRVGHPELARTLELVRGLQERRGHHWEPGARTNLAQLEHAARNRTLPLLTSRDERTTRALHDAQGAWQRSGSSADHQTLLTRRTEASALLRDDLADPARRPGLEAAVRAADVALARGRVTHAEDATRRALDAFREAPDSARRSELNHRLAEARSARRAGGLPADSPVTNAAASALAVLPPAGATRHRDLDPDGPDGPLGATYAGVRQPDGSLLQTRVRLRETHLGDGRWEQSFEAHGVTWRSADGKRYSERPGRSYVLRAADGGPLATPAEAVARARELLGNGAITTRNAPSSQAQRPNHETGRPTGGGFESQQVALPGGVDRLGNRNLSELRGLLDQSVGPAVQRYLAGGNSLIRLRGTDVENYAGVAMNLAPNVVPVPGGGPQVLFADRPAQAIAPVAAALRRAGGDAPQVRALPVFLRVDDTRMAQVPLFRVGAGDGRERLVDHEGRTYGSLDEWKRSNTLGALDVFVPRGARMQGAQGKVLLDAFDNRRFDNAALPVIRGGVAIVGAGAGVAAMIGSGGTAAPIVLGAASVFSAADGSARLHDRAAHGQTLGLGDETARMAWLDVAAGALGAGAIGTGIAAGARGAGAMGSASRLLGRASDVADLLQLGEGGRQFARDYGEMKPGERAVAGAQLLFWGAMFGASLRSGAHSRFDLDALDRSMAARPPGSDRSMTAVLTRGTAAGAAAPRPAASPPPSGRTDATAAPPSLPQAQQASAEAARARFSDRGFANALHRAALRKAGNDPGALQQLIGDPARMAALADATAGSHLRQQMFGGSGVPADLQRRFEQAAVKWATAQRGPAAAHLEQLARSGSQRVALLRDVVAQHLGGGSARLEPAIARELAGATEPQLKALLSPVNGQPQRAAIRLMQDALVARWSQDFGLDGAGRGRLDQAVGERLKGLDPQAQRVELVNLSSSDAVRRALVRQAQRPAAAEPAGAAGGTPAGRPERPVAASAPAATPPLTAIAANSLGIDSRAAVGVNSRFAGQVDAVSRVPDVQASARSPAATGPRTLTNAFGFTNLVDVGDVRPGDGLRSIERVPPLDPGSKYIGTIQSVPGHPVRIAWTPAASATVDGAPAPARAARDSDVHAAQAQRFFGRTGPDTAGFEITYRDSGPVVLRTDTADLNRETLRVGTREFPPLAARAGRPGADPGVDPARITDREAVLELAQYVAKATGRPVVIGDPPADGVPYPGVLSPLAPARAPDPIDPTPAFGPALGFNAFGVSNRVRTAEGIRATAFLPALPADASYQGVISSPGDGRITIAWEPVGRAVGAILPAPVRAPDARGQAERFFTRADPQLAGTAERASVLAGFQATYSRDGTVVLGIRSPELNGAAGRIGLREFQPAATAPGGSGAFFDDPAALGELARLVANQTRRTVVIGPDVSPSQQRLIGREFGPDPIPELGLRPPHGTLRDPPRFDEPVDWTRLLEARTPRDGRGEIAPYRIPANPRQPDGPTRQVTTYPPGTMHDGELLTRATMQTIENPRSYDSPRAAARAARALDRAWVVEVTQDGSIERGLASLRPDWNGQAAAPGTAYLGNVFGSPPQPAAVIGAREDLRGAGRQAAQAALDLGFGRLGQQAVVGYTTGAGARNLYHAMDAPRQRIEFTDVRIDRKALGAALDEIGDGPFPMASHPRLMAALNARDPDAALAELQSAARRALNARAADGALQTLAERGPDGKTRLPLRIDTAAREVLELPDGIVRYDFRFSRPPALDQVNPRQPLPERWGEADALQVPVTGVRTAGAGPDAPARSDTQYWPPAPGGTTGLARMSELELAKQVDEARTLLAAGVDPSPWGLGIRAWQRLPDGRFDVAVQHVPGEALSTLALPPDRLREIGRQLEERIASLRERGLHPTDVKPEHVLVTRSRDGAIDSVRLIDPYLFDVRHAQGWDAQTDPMLGALRAGRHPAPPPAQPVERPGASPTHADPGGLPRLLGSQDHRTVVSGPPPGRDGSLRPVNVRDVDLWRPGGLTETQARALALDNIAANPRSYGPQDVGRLTELFQTQGHVVRVTQRAQHGPIGPPREGSAAAVVTPHYNGQARQAGVAYLSNVYAFKVPGAGETVTRAAIDIARGLGQDLVGYTTGVGARNLYRGLDAPGQRIDFPQVRMPEPEALRTELDRTLTDAAGRAVPVYPPDALPLLRRALDGPDARAALQDLAQSARAALNARSADGSLAALPAPGDAGAAPAGIGRPQWDAAREVLQLPDGLVRYDFRYRLAPDGSADAAPPAPPTPTPAGPVPPDRPRPVSGTMPEPARQAPAPSVAATPRDEPIDPWRATAGVGTPRRPGVPHEPTPDFDRLRWADLDPFSPETLRVTGDLGYRLGTGALGAGYRQHVERPIQAAGRHVQQAWQDRVQTPVAAALEARVVRPVLETPFARQLEHSLTQWSGRADAARASLAEGAARMVAPLDAMVRDQLRAHPGVAHGLESTQGALRQGWERAGAATVASLQTTAKTLKASMWVAGSATLALLANASVQGTLRTGEATAGDPSMPPEAKAASRALNLPRGLRFTYLYAPIPGLEHLGGRAIVALGVTGGAVLPPATGPGQSGVAQPWAGINTRTGGFTATTTAVATGPLAVLGFNVGTPNLNQGMQWNAALGRAGLNLPRLDVGGSRPGGHAADLSGVLSLDWASMGTTATVNVWDRSLVVGRYRDPVSVKAVTGTAGTRLNPLQEGIVSQIEPVVPITGSTTFDPTAPDAQALRQWLEQRGLGERQP